MSRLYLAVVVMAMQGAAVGAGFASKPHTGVLTVVSSQSVQPFSVGQEDDYTASEALFQTGYFNPQVTVHADLLAHGKLSVLHNK